MAFSGHPILSDIRGGFKLKPTKTVDKSKPIFLAEGEVADFSAAIDKSKNLENLPATSAPVPKATSPRPSWKDKKVETAPAPDFPGLGAGGVPPPPPPPPGGFGMPPPPPPPMGGFAPPPPAPAAPVAKRPLNPKLMQLGGAATRTDEDMGALLKSIQDGRRLKKTVTNDKSGLVIDEDMRQASVKRCEPTGPPPEVLALANKAKASPTGRGQLTPNTLSPRGNTSEDERYLTPDERDYSDYGTPEPDEDERPRSKWSRTPEPEKTKKIDYAFDEKNLKVTAETLKEEIPKGLAASMAAKWLQAENVDGGATPPRRDFRASPARMSSPFNEVNNNQDKPTLEQLKQKPSKWAVVDSGGLKRPGQGNVPAERSREPTPRATTPRPYRDRTDSNLAAPIMDRARTASPTLEFTSSRRRSSARESSPEIEVEPEPVVVKKSPISKRIPEPIVEKKEPEVKKAPEVKKEEPVKKVVPKKKTGATTASAAKKVDTPLTIKTDLPSPSSTKVGSPLSINTDFASPSRQKLCSKPEIKETPPTPKHTQKTNGYSYKRAERPVSPPEQAPSPVSSMSSASVPSPSSISPGSTSPEQQPRRSRPINPNFDKMKEKFVSGEVSNATPSGTKTERLNKIGNFSIKDNVFARASASPMRDSVTPTADEATAVKKAVKEAAAKRVISVPISAPWHTPRDPYSPSYSSRDSFSPSYSSRDAFSPSYTSRRTFDFPSVRDTWRTPSRDYSSKYAGMTPDDFRRNYRFNIDLSNDAPLSLSRR